MKLIAIISAIILSFSVHGIENAEKIDEKREVNIALYDSISPSVSLLERSFHYAWNENGIKYEMNVHRIDYKDVMNGLDDYDVLVIGASGRQYFHGLLPKWRENVKEFIANGGGYVGICGGANIASKGYENPRHLLDYIINIASLGIVDAYINDDQEEEWQYLWKEAGRSNIPLKNVFIKKHPVFNNETWRYITYGGGPGMYGVEKAEPIAFYAEEPMEVAPLHYWRWLGKWIPYKIVRTDIKEYYSILETKYGNGKVLVFGPHPEIPPRLNGSVEEFFGLSIYGIPRYVYTWKGGEQLNMSYNWWIIRRSIAYVCNLPLPPAEELFIYLSYPNNGEVEAYAENAEKVEFYVDGNLAYVDENPPFKMIIDSKGEHVVKAIAYKNNVEAWDERVVEVV